MKKTLIAFSLVLSVVGAALAQQTNTNSSANRPTGNGTTLEQNSAGSVTTGKTDQGSTNTARPNSTSTTPNNGTNATTGLNNTLEQNSNGTIAAGAPTPTATDSRSSTTTTGNQTKARTKRSELVNLKKNN